MPRLVATRDANVVNMTTLASKVTEFLDLKNAATGNILTLTLDSTITHQFLKRLLLEQKLLKVYTQNIDCLETHMKTGSRGSIRLKDRTVFMHGSISDYKCSLVESHKGTVDPSLLEAWRTGQSVPCPDCFPYSSFGRRIPAGNLLPDIDLYNSASCRDRVTAIHENKKVDLVLVDCFIVVGTSLRKEVLGATRLVKEFLKAVERNGGLSFWINPKEVSKEMKSLFNVEVLMEADDVFSEIFSMWKPQLKKLKMESISPVLTRRERRERSLVDYSGMDQRHRKSMVEINTTDRLKNRILFHVL